MNNKCISVKNKNEIDKRCSKNAIVNGLCGIHCKCKNVILFEDVIKNVYTYNNLPSYNNINKNNIKINIKYYNIKTNKKESRNLYNILFNHLKLLSNKDKNIILIQNKYRNHINNKLKKCVNQEDFYSLDNIKLIPIKYRYFIKQNNTLFCFDLRSLYEYFKNKNNKILNPYNNVPFDENTINNIKMYFNKFKFNKDFFFKKEILSNEQIEKQRLLSIFQHYDNLGFMLNIEWFSNLSFLQLKSLYYKCEDIWNYRAQLNNEQKLNIVHNGKLFTISNLQIKKMRNHEKHKLKNIILTNFNRAATEGVDEANRRLGAILMLTGFAEISQDVMISYPWLSQSF